VTFVWPDKKTAGPVYRLIKSGALWKLDGVKCTKDEDYDRDFNYTKTN
jgi:hypothetical protein